MAKDYRMVFLVFIAGIPLLSHAETFRCVIGGKTVISDTPCVAGAKALTLNDEKVTPAQQRQAELVHQKNQSQLYELERKAAATKNARGGVYILGEDTKQPGTRNYYR